MDKLEKQERLEQLKKEYEFKKLEWAVEQAKIDNSDFYPVLKAEYNLKVLEREIEKAQEELKVAK